MKKLFSLVLVLVMVLTLCACGGETPNNIESTGSANDATQSVNQTPSSDATEGTKETTGTRPPSRLPEETYEDLPVSCEHAFKDADCTTGKICSICSFELSPALGHDFVDGVCSRCGAAE